MGKSAAPRKKYKGKRIVPGGNMTPVLIRFSAAEMAELKQIPRDALAALEQVRATADDWLDLTQNLGYMRVLVKRHVAEPEALAAVDAALDVMIAIEKREKRVGKVGATPAEIAAISDALDVTEQVLPIVTRREIRDAMLQALREAATF